MNLFEMFEQEEQGPSKPTLINALRDFLPIAVEHLGLDHFPKIKLEREIKRANVPTFGRFDNDSRVVSVAIQNRHPIDIIRTIAHELVHYTQELKQELGPGSWHTGSPMEDEANAEAGVMMREFDKQFPQYLSMEPVVLPTSNLDEDFKPAITNIYFFRVDDPVLAKDIGLRQSKHSNDWMLFRFNTSGRGFDRSYSDAVRLFGQPIGSKSMMK